MSYQPTPESRQQYPNQAQVESGSRIAKVVYLLQGAAFIVGISFFVAVVLAYAKRDRVAGTWVASHFKWQINTFWYGMLWTIVGSMTLLFLVGYLILLLNAFWIIYRIAAGWIALSEGRPAY